MKANLHMKKNQQTSSWINVKKTHLGTSQTAAAAKSLQSCLTLCDPIDGSPQGFPIPGILQARTLEWVAISFSNAWKRKVKVKSLSPVRLFATPWTAAYQAPPSMGFSRQEYESGLPLPSPTIKLLKTKDKERILKTVREKWYIICRGIMIKVSVDHSSEIMQAKNKWHVIFTALNGISTEWKQNKTKQNFVDPEFCNQWKYPSRIKVK